MLKSLKELTEKLIDYILPLRTDFSIVKKLDETTITALPKAVGVEKMDWIHPLFQYKNNKVRAIVWELKYKNNTLPLDTVGKLIFDEILALTSDILTFNSQAEFVLIPIPITSARRSERGYNQSEHLGRAILENDLEHILLYAPQWLSKIKETSEQNKSQSKEERMANMINSFEANPQVEEKYIILIDDVVTTGSTLSEARKELLERGARDVFAFTIAH